MAKKISIDIPSEQITALSVTINATQVSMSVNKLGTGGRFTISGFIVDETEIDAFMSQINKQ